MKVTRERVAKNRQRILEVAGKLFREKGFDGVGVADIMNRAGLTHGGFYGHFASKDELAAQACEGAAAKNLAPWTALAVDKSPDRFEAFVTGYLSPHHRDHPGSGCILAALGAEAARQPDGVRAAFTAGMRSIAAMLTKISPGRSAAARRENALATLAGLVGALTLARAADDPALSDEILNAALKTLSGKSNKASTSVHREPMTKQPRNRKPR
jgi:TetR/AcrR family transcriptional repressor of nem operon